MGGELLEIASVDSSFKESSWKMEQRIVIAVGGCRIKERSFGLFVVFVVVVFRWRLYVLWG